MMIMIVKKNLWTQAATLLKLEINLTMQHLLLSMEADHNMFLTMENMNMYPLCLSSLPIYSILGHHHQCRSSLLSSIEQNSVLSAFSLLSHLSILCPHHHLEE
jgi:hypothetical protein